MHNKHHLYFIDYIYYYKLLGKYLFLIPQRVVVRIQVYYSSEYLIFLEILFKIINLYLHQENVLFLLPQRENLNFVRKHFCEELALNHSHKLKITITNVCEN